MREIILTRQKSVNSGWIPIKNFYKLTGPDKKMRNAHITRSKFIGIIYAVIFVKLNLAQTINSSVSIVVLGTVQDAGSPQIACQKTCCIDLYSKGNSDRKVVSLALLDSINQKTFLVEAGPDIVNQVNQSLTYNLDKSNRKLWIDGILLSHAHIGHYSGLIFLGKEAMDAKNTPVYLMPKFAEYLQTNGPWEMLVRRQNIQLNRIKHNLAFSITEQIQILPVLVPHRDEYSETVGFKIIGPNKSAWFIPDIDKWEKWNHSIIDEIKQVDYAFIDASFYSANELPNRDIKEIPHPTVLETVKLFETLDFKEKNKIIFIHFNHTNPLLNKDSEESKSIEKMGFRIARIHQRYYL